MCKPNKSKELSIETLRELLSYNPDTGELTWKPRGRKWFKTERAFKTWNTRYANRAALTAHNRGYRYGTVLGRKYLAHRVAWAIHYGEWPGETIDHINGNRADNRIINLRAVSNAENHRNEATPKNNTSGVMGVFWCKARRKWRAQIKINGKTKHLGSFLDKEDAIRVRNQAEIDYGFHENHGRNSISEQSVLA